MLDVAHRHVLAFSVGALLVGFLLGILWSTRDSTYPYADMTREGGYEYINPLLSCDISEELPYPGYRTFSTNLHAVVENEIQRGMAERASVYIRDMNSGRWTGVDADGLYAPASLLKVPLFIAYLKQSQHTPQILQTAVLIPSEDTNKREMIQPKNPLVLGRSYALGETLRAMIADSDNNAAEALSAHAPEKELADVYGDFGIPVALSDDANIISPKMYMRLFRILYNSSYLERDKSQYALDLMAHSTFVDGLVAGLPQGTPVSHKFGEREIYATGTVEPLLVQLHDCGIVYYPRTPYGICIMTEGKKLDDLKLVISSISKQVYEDVKAGALLK